MDASTTTRSRMFHDLSGGRFMQCVLAALLCSASIASAQAFPGELDLQFGTSGLARVAMAGTDVTVTAAAQQSDGRIVLVGSCTSPGGDLSFCITRFDTNGVHNGGVYWHPVSPGGPAVPRAVAIDAQDRIVVGGSCTTNSGGMDFCLMRLQRNGLVDPQFANANGEVVTAVSSGTTADAINSIVIQPDGRILAGGYCKRGTFNAVAFCIVRYLSNGAIDYSFGNQGVSLGYFQSSPVGAPTDVIRAMTILPNGEIVAVGDCEVTAGIFRFCAMGFPPNGGMHLGAAGAYNVSTVAAPSAATAVAQQADGNLIVGGRCSNGSATTGIDFCLIRLSPSLVLDASFGVAGTRRTPIGYGNRADSLASLAIQPDGRIIAAGTCGVNATTPKDAFCWVRYMSNGEEDRAIHSNADGVGTVVTEFTTSAANDRAVAVMQRADGLVIIAGGCQTGVGSTQYQTCVARYKGGPFAYTHCSPDIDGDGKFNPLVDGLIAARIAAGMRNSAVMQGIQPPSGARRSGWDNDGIASYLSRACGVRGLSYTGLSASP